MKLFGWFEKKDTMAEVSSHNDLARELGLQAAKSQETLVRIEKIIDVEKVRLRNLELRAEVLSRSRG